MPCIYDYVCRTCGAKTELDRLPEAGADMRHLVHDTSFGEAIRVCGTFRRDWSSINVTRVPGGRP